MATLLIEKKSLNVWLHTPSDFQPYIISQFYAKSNGDNFSVFEFSGVQRGIYHYSDISIKDGLNPIESGFTSINQVMLRLEELLYVGFEFDGEVVPASLISSDPSNALTTGTDNKLFVPDTGEDVTADHFKGNWNASTNTPILTNGIGQVGDYYRVSVGGTQFSTGFEIGDIISYNGTTWYMFVNNHQSPVLTTNTNITSSSLSTQDVSGFVAYINALVSSFSVAVNEIRTYTVTDTRQKFEILLRGRSFGGSEPDIVTSDVLELEPSIDFLSFTTRATHTGTTAYTRLGTITIPANFIPEGSVWEVQTAGSRGISGVAAAATLHVSFSTGNPEGSDFIRGVPIGTGTLFISHVSRRIIFRNGNREMFNNSGNFPTDFGSAQNNNIIAFDRTVVNQLFVGITLSNAADTAFMDYLIFKRIG